jgi:SAM-dependent methyltransferase
VLIVDKLHGNYVHTRRVRVMAEAAAQMIPFGANVLDVGCGDGMFAEQLQGLRSDITIKGAEVQSRPGCRIPVTAFDGLKLPFADNTFDVSMLVDVVHHSLDQKRLLSEAARVGSGRVLLKDHPRNGPMAWTLLRGMDYVGNTKHGVACPHKYLSRDEWMKLFGECGLRPGATVRLRKLYHFPISLVIGHLNFMTVLEWN